MQCKIDNCDRAARYKAKQLCQMHYFRMMRNGKPELTLKTRRYRNQTPDGYQLIDKPGHPLSHKNGYVSEHRFLIYEKYGASLPDCEICGKPTNWETCHIDHKDNDPTNNEITNLRPLCRACNTFRDYPEQHTINGRHSIVYDGKTMTAQEWARQHGVYICGSSIIRRLRCGLSVHDALFSHKKTHNGKPRVDNRPKKTTAKYQRKNAIIVMLDGVSMSAAEASRHPLCNVCEGTLVNRIKSGMDHQQAVFTSPRTGKNKKGGY